jgi:hypothetical protein
MTKKIAIIILLACFCLGAANAQALTKQQVAKQKAQLAKLEKDLNRLQNKLKSAKGKQLIADIKDKLDLERAQIKQIKQRLYPKAAKLPTAKAATPEVAPLGETLTTVEAGGEEGLSSLEAEGKAKLGSGDLRHEIGGSAGFFAGTTAFLGEIRVPLRLIFGPATTTVRLATGLAQTKDSDRRLVPVNLDLIFNFPPGWFTGVENYLGAGLNYVALTSGRKQGTVGGQVSYGIVSSGFGGNVYGEIGYAILRTGFSPSYKGATVMVGFRKALF